MNIKGRTVNLALTGYANVGKSVVFNHLTGLHQHIGNWPGKTIEKAEGTLHYKGYTMDVIDLPGIYSLSTYSLEEIITREYIVSAKPDFIINVSDATNLERNLALTLQILELEKPTVLALNMVNLLKRTGIEIDFKKLELIMGIPVVPIAAIQGKGLTDILDRGIELANQDMGCPYLPYGKEVEDRIKELSQLLERVTLPYPKRFISIKLLEYDSEIVALLDDNHKKILKRAEELRLELEKIHGHSSSVVIADERCHLAAQISKQVVSVTGPQKLTSIEIIDYITGHRFWGYPAMLAILGMIFFIVFKGGNYAAGIIESSLSGLKQHFYSIFGTSILTTLAWGGVSSFIALVEIAFPYILPFYLLLFALEGSGYLSRASYLMDNFMHKVGIHGKACIPLILGFGCNVPACLSCRIMETQRERMLTGILTAFVPCSAVTVVIAGLVSKYLGIEWALGLYLFLFILIFVLGKIASALAPGEATELIMEMPSYKVPHLKTVLLQTWFRLKEFIYIAAPIVVISGILIEGAYYADLLNKVNSFLAPITVNWLGLPAVTGVLLIFGILRKELILIILASILGTADFTTVLTKTQMLVLALISMLYIPCAATIAALYKEFGWQKALLVTVLKISLALLVAGLAFRISTTLHLFV